MSQQDTQIQAQSTQAADTERKSVLRDEVENDSADDGTYTFWLEVNSYVPHFRPSLKGRLHMNVEPGAGHMNNQKTLHVGTKKSPQEE